jgi:hypothetical protein
VALGAVHRELSAVRIVARVAAAALHADARPLAIDVARFAQDIAVLSGERKAREVVIDRSIVPTRRGMTLPAGRAQSSLVDVGGGVAVDALGRRGAQSGQCVRALVAEDALDLGVPPDQRVQGMLVRRAVRVDAVVAVEADFPKVHLMLKRP